MSRPNVYGAARFLIYGLTDPRTEKIRYIGKSCKGMARPYEHAYPGILKRTAHTPRGCWIKSLLALGLKYGVTVLESFPSEVGLYEAEHRWIAHGRAEGWPLTNLADGGPGTSGWKMPAETRAKIGAANKGRKYPKRPPRPPDVQERINAANRGKTRSPETRARISASKKGQGLGRKMSPESIAKSVAGRRGWHPTSETRARMRASRIGKKQSPETIARRAAALRGKKHTMSDSWRKNVARAHRERVWTDEMRAMSRAASTGKKQSSETIAKRVASMKARREAILRAVESIGTEFSLLDYEVWATVWKEAAAQQASASSSLSRPR